MLPSGRSIPGIEFDTAVNFNVEFDTIVRSHSLNAFFAGNQM